MEYILTLLRLLTIKHCFNKIVAVTNHDSPFVLSIQIKHTA